MNANVVSYIFSAGAWLLTFIGFTTFILWFVAPEFLPYVPLSNKFAGSDFYGEPEEDFKSAILIDVALWLLFVVPHTTLANNYLGTKDKIPICFERSFFILQATTMLHILMTYWRPFGKTIYDVRDTPFLGSAIKAFSAFGFVFLMTSCFALDYFHLFGLSQGFGVDINKMVGLAPPTTSEGGLSTRWHYSIVAHPIMCGLLMEFWACARMTSSRLLLNVMGTMYCIGGVILFEEKKLEKELGKEYTEYLQTVPRFCPFMPPAIGKFPKSKEA